MLRRIRGLSEGSLRTLDRALVGGLIAVEVIDLSTNSNLEGPLWLNIAVMTAIAVSFLWRRTQPWVTVVSTLAGMVVMAVWLTQPPNMFAAVLIIILLGYAAGRHMAGRPSTAAMALGATVILTLAIVFDPSDVFFPVTFFWIVPWVVGRTSRSQTLLTRELAEKAERAQHAREEDERRAIATERNRIARELHDVLAHNLSVMVVQATGARQVLEKDPGRAVEAAALIERTGREALAELRHLFGPVRRGDGVALSGPPSIARIDELAAPRARCRAAGGAARDRRSRSSCPPASTSPRTGSSRRRSPTRSSTRRAPARA